jgi:hypothetical protein
VAPDVLDDWRAGLERAEARGRGGGRRPREAEGRAARHAGGAAAPHAPPPTLPTYLPTHLRFRPPPTPFPHPPPQVAEVADMLQWGTERQFLVKWADGAKVGRGDARRPSFFPEGGGPRAALGGGGRRPARRAPCAPP